MADRQQQEFHMALFSVRHVRQKKNEFQG